MTSSTAAVADVPTTAPANAYTALAPLFEPRNVAIIGASDTPGNLGARAVALLAKFGYPGAVWPVNPRRDTVSGVRCYRDLADLPGPADLAILSVPAAATVDAVRACARAGIRHAIAWAGGFAESGAEGVALQRALTTVCRDAGVKLCGPNSLGVVNAWLPLTATFASSLVRLDRLLRGSISMVSQSGGLAMATQAEAQAAGFGFRHMISSGNEAVLGMADYLDALVDDPRTRVIAAYLEGVADGDAFAAALVRARAAGKPVVMLKAGITPATARAAAAHTGALVGDDRVWQAVMREHDVIAVTSTRELLDVAVFLSSTDARKLPAGRRAAIVTFGGGGGVLATDLCARQGLATPPLAPATLEHLAPLVPPIASTANPIDLTPATFDPQWLAHFPAALDAIAADAGIDALFFPLSAMARGAADVAHAIGDLRERTAKTVGVSWVLAPEDGREALVARGVYAFPDSARAIDTLAKVAAYATAPSPRAASARSAPIAFDWTAFVPNALAGQVVAEDACHRLLAAAGLPVAAGRLTTNADDSVRAAASVGYPVALKGIAAAVTHRAAAGLVALDRRDARDVAGAHAELASRAQAQDITLDGVYVQHMMPGRLELLVAAFRDPVFGVMVTCGAGGALTELIDDVTLERAPFDGATALAMLKRLRLVQRIDRIDPTAGLEAPADFLARFALLAAAAPWQRFVFEINPVKWHGSTVAAVDGLIIIETP